MQAHEEGLLERAAVRKDKQTIQLAEARLGPLDADERSSLEEEIRLMKKALDETYKRLCDMVRMIFVAGDTPVF
jgi:hypothetical protein